MIKVIIVITIIFTVWILYACVRVGKNADGSIRQLFEAKINVGRKAEQEMESGSKGGASWARQV